MKPVPASLAMSALQIHSLLSDDAVGWVQVFCLVSQVRHVCCLHRGKLELKDVKVAASAVLYSFELHLPELSGLAVPTEAFSKAWGSSVSQFLLCCRGGVAVDGYQQHLKRWRKGYEAFRVLSPGSGLQWGEVHIIAVTLQYCQALFILVFDIAGDFKLRAGFLWSYDFRMLLSACSWSFGKVVG